MCAPRSLAAQADGDAQLMRCARSGVGLRSSRQGERNAQAQTPALIRDLESRRIGGSPGSMQLLEQFPCAAERASPGGLEGRTILSSVVREVRLARADVEKVSCHPRLRIDVGVRSAASFAVKSLADVGWRPVLRSGKP